MKRLMYVGFAAATLVWFVICIEEAMPVFYTVYVGITFVAWVLLITIFSRKSKKTQVRADEFCATLFRIGGLSMPLMGVIMSWNANSYPPPTLLVVAAAALPLYFVWNLIQLIVDTLKWK